MVKYYDADAPRTAPMVPVYTEALELETPKKVKVPKKPKPRVVVSQTK
jgi:hypothetical protein